MGWKNNQAVAYLVAVGVLTTSIATVPLAAQAAGPLSQGPSSGSKQTAVSASTMTRQTTANAVGIGSRLSAEGRLTTKAKTYKFSKKTYTRTINGKKVKVTGAVLSGGSKKSRAAFKKRLDSAINKMVNSVAGSCAHVDTSSAGSVKVSGYMYKNRYASALLTGVSECVNLVQTKTVNFDLKARKTAKLSKIANVATVNASAIVANAKFANSSCNIVLVDAAANADLLKKKPTQVAAGWTASSAGVTLRFAQGSLDSKACGPARATVPWSVIASPGSANKSAKHYSFYSPAKNGDGPMFSTVVIRGDAVAIYGGIMNSDALSWNPVGKRTSKNTFKYLGINERGKATVYSAKMTGSYAKPNAASLNRNFLDVLDRSWSPASASVRKEAVAYAKRSAKWSQTWGVYSYR